MHAYGRIRPYSPVFLASIRPIRPTVLHHFDSLNRLFDAIAENDLLSDSTRKPWLGYAWNKGGEKLEWMLVRWETQARMR